jgi:hypothetical protein
MSTKKQLPEPVKKRKYRRPMLKTYGDLKKLTLAKGGSASDGAGLPKTKMGAG